MPALINLKPVQRLQLVGKTGHLKDVGSDRAPDCLEESQMRRFNLFSSIIAIVVLVLSAVAASAQTGQLRGHVIVKQADGTTVKAADAQIDVFRTDMAGAFHTKTDKKGEFVFAGLPFIGTYIVAASLPTASPYAMKGVKVGRDVDYEIVLGPGNGKRLTEEEAKKAVAGGGQDATTTGGSESAADKAKREELLKKNAEIEAGNKKAEDINKIVGEAFKAGNAALTAKNYEEAVKQYDIGLAADSEQAALLTNKAAALKARGVDKYNAAIQSKDDAARTAGIDAAKADFKNAAETSDKAFELIKKEPAVTDPNDQKRHDANKYAALNVRAEAYRLYVSKGDGTKADAGVAAFQDYIAVETDAAKKSKAQLDLAQMLLDAGASDKALAEFQKILAANPDDPDANLGAGLALYGTGDKTKYQEAANYLQHFVDKAPDTNRLKSDAKAVLAEMKNTDNVVPEKTAPPRRRRP
jgi:tetratricopeptide (TPR) repeat protein